MSKKHKAVTVEVLSYGGPFQAIIELEGNAGLSNYKVMVHYKHGFLRVVPISMIDQTPMWGSYHIGWYMNVEFGTLEDASLTLDELKDILGGLIDFSGASHVGHTV